MIDRRNFLALSTAFSVLPVFGQAKSTQVLGMYRRAIGEMVVTAFLDGHFNIPSKILAGVDEATQIRLMQKSFLSEGPIRTSVNAYLIETADRKILIDGGMGAEADGFGGLARGLDAMGVAASDINTVFCTHLHRDHVGAFLAGDAPAFGDAELLAHTDDVAFWTTASNFDNASDRNKGFAALATKVVGAYGDRVRTVGNVEDIAPGITTMHLPGHTPGHTGLTLSSGGENLLIWADIVHLGPIQFAQPQATVPFDIDPEQAITTRRRIFDMVATDRLEVAGSHIDFPSFGHLEAADDGVAFVPSRWDHTL